MTGLTESLVNIAIFTVFCFMILLTVMVMFDDDTQKGNLPL